METINWYPGHMKKTREMIRENLKRVDVVLEIIDARIPVSSRNPIIDELTDGKKRVVLLNKSDLADDAENSAWAARLTTAGADALLLNGVTGAGVKDLIRLLTAAQAERNAEKPRKRPLRTMIVGVPNVGKSSLINRLAGKKSARTGDRPGVTRGKQWLTLENNMQLLDTPGILWPKFEDPQAGRRLAFCGSIKDEILDAETLALELIRALLRDYPRCLAVRYGLTPEDLRPDEAILTMEAVARRRGFLLSGKRIDYARTARTVLDEFRGGRIGRITLEKASFDRQPAVRAALTEEL
jgi:ribosome biogenesis GTPase A